MRVGGYDYMWQSQVENERLQVAVALKFTVLFEGTQK